MHRRRGLGLLVHLVQWQRHPSDIGYFTLAPTLPAGLQIDQTVFDIGSSLYQARCRDFYVTLTGDGNAKACFILSAHDADPCQVPSAACCLEEHCFELPPCGSTTDCATPVLFDIQCTATGGTTSWKPDSPTTRATPSAKSN